MFREVKIEIKTLIIKLNIDIFVEIPYSSVDDTFFVSDDSTEDDELVIDITNSETFRQSHEE